VYVCNQLAHDLVYWLAPNNMIMELLQYKVSNLLTIWATVNLWRTAASSQLWSI